MRTGKDPLVILGFSMLLLFQLVGEVLTHVSGLPIPGPVVGMVLLVVALEIGLPAPDGLASASDGLLANLSLLFVPAGVGIVQHAARLSREWQALGLALLVSTAATVAVTGWVASRLARASAARDGGRP